MDAGSPTKSDLERILTLVPTVAWDVTVPILLEHGSGLHQHGTGTLLRVAHEYFIVTASHVPRDAFAACGGLFLTSNADGGRFVEARGTWHASAQSPSGNRDLFDVAILHLAVESVAELSDRSFLSLDEVWKRLPLEDDIYVVCGFPRAMSVSGTAETCKLTLGPLKIVTSLYDGPTMMLDCKTPKFENYDPRFHFLLNANKRNIRAMEGFEGEFPDDLRGISGCSVWKMNVKSYPRDKWSSENARIVGVQNCAYQSRAIRATHWSSVAALLLKTMPKLAPSLALWRPN